jgi:hypothetical protein
LLVLEVVPVAVWVEIVTIHHGHQRVSASWTPLTPSIVDHPVHVPIDLL